MISERLNWLKKADNIEDNFVEDLMIIVLLI